MPPMMPPIPPQYGAPGGYMRNPYQEQQMLMQQLHQANMMNNNYQQNQQQMDSEAMRRAHKAELQNRIQALQRQLESLDKEL